MRIRFWPSFAWYRKYDTSVENDRGCGNAEIYKEKINRKYF